jgi:hypothetical protein
MSMSAAMPFRDSKGLLWARGKRTRPSEGELADRFAEQHSREVRYLAGRERVWSLPARKPGWIYWAGEEWLPDTQHLALRLARAVCQEAAEAYGDPAIDSHRSVAGVLALAKCDPRLVAQDWPCDPFIEAAVSEWLADHCVLSPDAWTPRADLLATFVNWQDFDREDLTAALEVRGLSYVRRGNIHGFCGVRLKDGDDVDA